MHLNRALTFLARLRLFEVSSIFFFFFFSQRKQCGHKWQRCSPCNQWHAFLEKLQSFLKSSQIFLFLGVVNFSKIRITHLLSQCFHCVFFKMHLALEIWNWWKFFHHCCTSFVNPVLTILKIEFVFAPLQPTSCRNVLESFKMSRSFPGMIRTIVLFIFKPFILKVNFPLYDFWVNLF